ncbi:protein ninX [Edwardsiella piscicida]|uniref:protein ninX n=1 Tax=Edwardsiella piscicida TaxID=1263550 RepID=UPI00370D5360
MNYEEMSDSDIAAKVFEVSHGVIPDFKEHPDGGISLISYENDIISGEDVEVVGGRFNPLNNLSDMWPLISENNMSICSIGGNGPWMVRSGTFSSIHTNPLRAAAIVYLMMKEKDHESRY